MEMKKGCLKHPTSNIQPRTPNGGISRAFASLEVGCSRLDVRCFFFSLFLLLCFPARAAEEFGDISVSAAAMFTGNTFHGYGEMRVTLENHSHSKAHVVTLAFPNNAYNNGWRTLEKMEMKKGCL